MSCVTSSNIGIWCCAVCCPLGPVFTWDVDEAAEKPHQTSSELLVENQEQERVHDGVDE